jgi:hypothetical protein
MRALHCALMVRSVRRPRGPVFARSSWGPVRAVAGALAVTLVLSLSMMAWTAAAPPLGALRSGGTAPDTAPSPSAPFQTYTYLDLIISETGLPAGTSWEAWVMSPSAAGGGVSTWAWGPTNSSNWTSGLGAPSLPPDWTWGVAEVPGYIPYPASGFVSPSPNTTVINVSFLQLNQHECAIGLTEVGLPAGTPWWASVDGFSSYAHGNVLYALSPCGADASVTFGSLSGLVPYPATVSVPVFSEEGAASGVEFLSPPSPPVLLPPGAILGGAVMVGVAAAGGFLLGRTAGPSVPGEGDPERLPPSG